ncbi:PASTA domain-containing protein [Streptomyces corynorhini]|uniref:PASTA domain-containing protein n=1 Tax=Streptomyces corynorhini TaxID=2282652 RepID=A0A370B6R7_9ACTN|nr:PASTA domain-containing protein [Streptomyces corynorhini]RDG35105.1 PASTA domain-containing protein [Streptomyces corynorhini]
MRTRTALALLGATALLTLTACEDTGGSTPPGAGATTARSALPDLVGKELGPARDAARAAGFRELTSHDALGRGRAILLDRNWKVCSQTPAPGTLPTGTTVDLGAVKTDEECPAEDPGEPAPTGTTMPDFTGRSVRFARAALGDSAHLDAKDVSGKDRGILLESNWKVCGQDPKAGTELTGQPVRLDTVKFGEDCP